MNQSAPQDTLPVGTARRRAAFGPGIEDLVNGFVRWEMWVVLAWRDVRRRYRRTMLGPFWSSLSMGIFIGCMGVVFSQLWDQPLAAYLPFLASGFIVWATIAQIIQEGCATFIGAEAILKQVPLPFSIFAFTAVARNIIVFGHHLLVYLVVMAVCQVPVNWNTLYFIPGLALLIVNGLWVSVLAAIFCTRYRDVQQLIASVLQIAMFVTPIMWEPSRLGAGHKLVDWNIAFHFIQILRAPLLGDAPTAMNLEVTLGVTVIGWLATALLFNRYRRQIIFWF